MLNSNKPENKINTIINHNENSNINHLHNNHNNLNTNETSSNISIKDRLKLLNSGNTGGFPMPGAMLGANSLHSQPKPLNAPIVLNHNIQSNHLNKLNEETKIKAGSETEKANNKTKEELEEEKRIKRERMKLKMGNSTSKIIAKNSEKDKEAEKLKENNKDESSNKVKNLASMLAEKIQFAPAAKGQFNNNDDFDARQQDKKTKLNKLFQGNSDVQFEQEIIVEDNDEESFNTPKNNYQYNCLKSSSKENDILVQHQKNLDDEDYFMKQIENKPRMMTTVKKFKKPEFKLDKY